MCISKVARSTECGPEPCRCIRPFPFRFARVSQWLSLPSDPVRLRFSVPVQPTKAIFASHGFTSALRNTPGLPVTFHGKCRFAQCTWRGPVRSTFSFLCPVARHQQCPGTAAAAERERTGRSRSIPLDRATYSWRLPLQEHCCCREGCRCSGHT